MWQLAGRWNCKVNNQSNLIHTIIKYFNLTKNLPIYFLSRLEQNFDGVSARDENLKRAIELRDSCNGFRTGLFTGPQANCNQPR